MSSFNAFTHVAPGGVTYHGILNVDDIAGATRSEGTTQLLSLSSEAVYTVAEDLAAVLAMLSPEQTAVAFAAARAWKGNDYFGEPGDTYGPGFVVARTVDRVDARDGGVRVRFGRGVALDIAMPFATMVRALNEAGVMLVTIADANGRQVAINPDGVEAFMSWSTGSTTIVMKRASSVETRFPITELAASFARTSAEADIIRNQASRMAADRHRGQAL